MDLGFWSQPGQYFLSKDQYAGGQEILLAGGRVIVELGFCS